MNRISASSTSISHPIPVSQLNEALHSADEAGSSLHAVIDRLEARLESFLTPQAPEGEKDSCGSVLPPCAPVVSKLKNQTLAVNHAANRIDSLLSRLCS